MKLKNNIKLKLLNSLMLKGKKRTTEKLVLKSLKRFQKSNFKKDSKEFIKVSLLNSAPSVQIKQIKKKRKTIEFPFLLNNDLKISYGLKSLIKNSRIQRSQPFYKSFQLELVNSSNSQGTSVNNKKQIHENAFLKKKYANYRWF
jgi:ribosomal protein S7